MMGKNSPTFFVITFLGEVCTGICIPKSRTLLFAGFLDLVPDNAKTKQKQNDAGMVHCSSLHARGRC